MPLDWPARRDVVEVSSVVLDGLGEDFKRGENSGSDALPCCDLRVVVDEVAAGQLGVGGEERASGDLRDGAENLEGSQLWLFSKFVWC